jgi:hypothetical protein
MKITEVEQMSEAKLLESINRENDTGFLTEDLVKIVDTHRNDQWSEPMDPDDFIAWMYTL